MNQPTLPGVNVDPSAPAPLDVAMAWIGRCRLALAASRARRRPHPDEAAVLAHGRAAHLAALAEVHASITTTPRTEPSR